MPKGKAFSMWEKSYNLIGSTSVGRPFVPENFQLNHAFATRVAFAFQLVGSECFS